VGRPGLEPGTNALKLSVVYVNSGTPLKKEDDIKTGSFYTEDIKKGSPPCGSDGANTGEDTPETTRAAEPSPPGSTTTSVGSEAVSGKQDAVDL
jgi:hypothetical protein